MIIDQLNLNHLRIFECVLRLKSVTAAARELHLTQSGVSQHLKTFEEMLGTRLFDRVNQKMVPTAEARLLFERCSRSLEDLEQALLEVKSQGTQVSGSVIVGMPNEFGHNVVLPLLAEFGRKNPLVKFHVRFGFTGAMNEALLSGETDFAFVDDLGVDRRIQTERVYDETLDLCASPAFLSSRSRKDGARRPSGREDRRFFEELEYVEYQRDEAILRLWFAHHLGTQHLRLNVRATVMDVQSVARLIVAGLGAGVLPHHLVLKLQEEGHELAIFGGSGTPLTNSVSIAALRERSHSAASSSLMEFLKQKISLTPTRQVRP